MTDGTSTFTLMLIAAAVSIIAGFIHTIYHWCIYYHDLRTAWSMTTHRRVLLFEVLPRAGMYFFIISVTQAIRISILTWWR